MSDVQSSTIDLSAGPIEYLDTGGDGPTIVLLHGVLMNHTVWRDVITELTPAFRCIAPTLPLGAHRKPMRPGSDLSIDGIALLGAEFLERLDLHDVTLIMNDWGGPQLLVDHGRTERISRLVLVACEAFDNFPPGRPGRRLGKLAAVPGGLGLQSLLMRSAAIRRSVATALVKHPVPDVILRDWFQPFIKDRAIRQDLRRYCLSVPLDSGRNWSAGLASFDKPALVVWAPEDQMMPRDHGRRLAELLPKGQLVEIEDSYTVIALDQPRQLADAVRAFISSTADYQ
ncbi:MAG TPA: alpha/beta hydrolase [Propionibacteriaceae bacterium]|nr:alpha/beta hydrolase [Propionibacteriaceae bacterium]